MCPRPWRWLSALWPIDGCSLSGSNWFVYIACPGILPHMTQSHPANKVHFACFDCRSCFKQPNSSNWNPDVERRSQVCPKCKSEMVRLGRYFKAPSKRAIRQWLKVELLHEFGERFCSGNSGLDRSCSSLSATISYLIECGHDESEVLARLQRIRDVRRSRT